jgi:LacI family transcriptional regulator
VLIAHDLTDVTRAALLDGTINFLLSQPIQTVAQETIAAMIRAHDGGPDFPPQSISLPFDIYTSENI